MPDEQCIGASVKITLPEPRSFSHIVGGRLELSLLMAHQIDQGIKDAIEFAEALGTGVVIAFKGNDDVMIEVTWRSDAAEVYEDYLKSHREHLRRLDAEDALELPS
jgi:hypothetical protein